MVLSGNNRAEKAMQFGLKMNNPAYNIYVSGNCGSGRITYTIKADRILSKLMKVKLKTGVMYIILKTLENL